MRLFVNLMVQKFFIDKLHYTTHIGHKTLCHRVTAVEGQQKQKEQKTS
jgi:hypothetical protein